MNAIEIKNLFKTYPGFAIKDVSFNLEQGTIMGFVGENGAGKSTTIKLILDLIHPDSGTVQVLGQGATDLPNDIKQHIGVVMDECNFPENLNIKQINVVLKNMYKNWDAKCFTALIARFGLPLNREVKKLSRGMKMQLAIAAAMSHGAKLLVLDEATSGLDPVVRDSILDLFLEFIQNPEHSVLISSHIISDLEKICDYLTFIHKGKIVLSQSVEALADSFALATCTKERFATLDKSAVIGHRENAFGIEALVRRELIPSDIQIAPASMESIMIYYVKGGF